MKNYVLAIIPILIGIGTVYITKTEKSDIRNAVIQGYIFNHSTNQWDRSVMCGTDGIICTVNGLPTGQQVFGTTGPEVDHPETANVELYKLE
ncbi:hypothetical protein [Epilithonimonas vandammei]|uniref:Uncharacterized protein n=1 Tax=Epilithonimonas vandammei TaxID=2487072 RepID=A0A3G8Y093_9FLAO|nr:hypothetical protein [Epilithonimonas vandammei]AZI38630.1 hypothetical protein EIB74_01010 [Epilithonimonas vandammei]